MKLSIQREIQFCQNKEIHSSFTKQILHVVSRGKLWSLPEVRHIWSQVERWRQGLPLQFQQIFFHRQTNKSQRTELSVLKITLRRTILYIMIAHETFIIVTFDHFIVYNWVKRPTGMMTKDYQSKQWQSWQGLRCWTIAVSRCLRYKRSLIQNKLLLLWLNLLQFHVTFSSYLFIHL